MTRMGYIGLFVVSFFSLLPMLSTEAAAQSLDCSLCTTLTCGTGCSYVDPVTGATMSSTCGGDLFNACLQQDNQPPSCSACPSCPTPNFQCVANGSTVTFCPAGPANCSPQTPPRGSQTSNFVLQWTGQSPAIGHQIGSAGGGGSWHVTDPNSQGWLSYGPYTTIPLAGDYVAVFNLGTDRLNSNGLGNIDVNDATTQTEIASRQPRNNDPAIEVANFCCYDLTLPFTVTPDRAGHQFEFRVFWFDTSSVTEGELGYVPLQWNGANSQVNPWHLVGQPIGTEWSASVGMGQNWFQYGPYVTLDPGIYIAMWTLKIDVTNTSYNDAVAIIDVNDATTQTVLSDFSGSQDSRQILRHDFLAPEKQQVFYMVFVVPAARAGHQFEFRVWYPNTAWLREEAFGVTKVQ
jgi:hypothetical protein